MKKSIILTVLAIIVSFGFIGCERGFNFVIRGEGAIVSEEIPATNFDRVELGGQFDIEITYGDTIEVIAEGQQNIIDRLKIRNYNGKLTIELENAIYRDYDLKIYVTIPSISEVSLSGSGNITMNEFENLNDINFEISGSGSIYSKGLVIADKVNFDISGSGNIDFTTECNEISTNISGSGDVVLLGTANIQNIDISGSGNFDCYGLTCNDAYIEVSGSGDCEIFANRVLNVDISGRGNVYYKGNPQVSMHISGLGSVLNEN
jgi:hypothetical protein